MTTPIRWYFDFVSPFAYLQWQLLRARPLAAPLDPLPILFAAVLNHHGQKGPAEIDSKRAFTYRFVHWQAARHGVPFRFPPAHPFNPVAALRLAWACGRSAAAIDAIFAHVWEHGRSGDSPAALADVARELGVADVEAALAAPATKDALRAATDAAIARGVFGVPTLDVDGELYWGADATEMAREALDRPAAFRDPEYARLAALPVGASRRCAARSPVGAAVAEPRGPRSALPLLSRAVPLSASDRTFRRRNRPDSTAGARARSRRP